MPYTLLVIKESAPKEGRVCLVPVDIKTLIENGHTVIIEKDAGIASGFDNSQYLSVGATLRENTGYYNALFKGIDLVVRAKRPTRAREKLEAKAFQKDMILVGALDPFEANGHVDEYKQAGIKAYSIDQMSLPIDSPLNLLASMSVMAGELALLDALEKSEIASPKRALIVGAGVAGKAALHQALKENLTVTIVVTKQEQANTLNAIDNVTAIVLDTNWDIDKMRECILPLAMEADIVVTSARKPKSVAPVLFPFMTLNKMKQGASIVDLALSEGGNVEGSKHDATLTTGNQVKVTNVSGYPKIKPAYASLKWSSVTERFIDLLNNESDKSLLDEARIA